MMRVVAALRLSARLGWRENFVVPEHLPHRPALRRVAERGEGCPVLLRLCRPGLNS